MLSSLLALAAAIAGEVPPVPGLCTAPMPADRDTPGCYATGDVDLAGAPATLWWHIFEYPGEASARAEAAHHRWTSVTTVHGHSWLYLIGDADAQAAGGIARAAIGPLRLPGPDSVAHFSEAIFPPGMRTRVHSHPGPEAFYVVAGEQCMETPSDRKRIPAGGTYVVDSGPHLQAAPKGRRNLVLILAPKGQAPVVPGGSWTPTGFCDR